MLGLKNLRKELSEMNSSMKSIGSQIGNMAEKILILSESMSQSMNKMTAELQQTNLGIRESLKITSNTIQAMSENFSKALENAIEKMSNLNIQMNIKDTILKSLGLDKLIPDFLKKK